MDSTQTLMAIMALSHVLVGLFAWHTHKRLTKLEQRHKKCKGMIDAHGHPID